MPDDVWQSFLSAGFTCWCPDPVVVRPAAAGTTAGPFPFAMPVAFLTADNPRGRVAPDAENVVRRAELAAALHQLDATWVPAVGGDPAGDHLEPGAAVLGLHIDAAASLGACFGQAAIYLWAPEALHLMACAGDRHDVLGYTATLASARSLPAPALREPAQPPNLSHGLRT